MPPIRHKKALKASETESDPLYLDEICRIVRSTISFPQCSRVDSNQILQASVALAGENSSISGFCSIYNGLPSHTTCLKVLHQLDMDEMRCQSSGMLQLAGKGVIRPGQRYTFAIDKTDDPYYGKRNEEPGSYIVGGKRKASTNYFFTYLTLSIIDKDHHITLYATPWQKGMNLVSEIKNCIEQISSLNLKIRCLCLDREFYVAEIFQYLQNNGIPHAVPIKEQGKQLKTLLSGRKSNSFTYTLNKDSENPVEVTILNCLIYLKGEGEKHGIRHHAFVIFGISPTPRVVRGIYRHRFAIESTYRLRNVTKPRTSSRGPVIRYFYTLVAFLYQNRWVAMKWKHFAKKQRGPKVVMGDRFTLAYFVRLMRCEVTAAFSLVQLEDIEVT